jgi:hypothetical protein
VFVAAGFLLASMGGAILAAPVTLPLMLVATRRHPTRSFRVSAAIIAGATAAEVAWAVAYVIAGEAGPWIWLAPLVGGLAVAFVAQRTSSPRIR